MGTSTTAFVGPTRKGPFRVDLDDLSTPELITSYGDFERIYGGFAELGLGAEVAATNFVAHAARAYFNKGGSRLYVARASPRIGATRRGRRRCSTGGGRRSRGRLRARAFPARPATAAVTVREVGDTGLGARRWPAAPAGTLLRTGPAGRAGASASRSATDWRPADDPGLAAVADPATLTRRANPRIVT